jgi:glutamyl-tRNA synthetase
MERPVRVRFAPSPTGALHIGGVRTALYNYLFARQHGGQFLVRIEDTDQERFVEGAEEYIFETLRWLGIPPDESPEAGGACAPYRQSERKAIYAQYIKILLDKGHAYYAFDTKEEIEDLRKRLEDAKSTNPSYNALTRNQMKNSLTLPADEVERRVQEGAPHVIRLKTPPREEIRFHDMIRGAQYVHSSTLDDKVLIKQDGLPTYHFANVVDDYLMRITHVFRGEEWLPSAPSHILLYQFFGWEKEMPQFAHLPLILAPDGSKLSKRKASEYGIPVFPLYWFNKETQEDIKGYRENGYLPEALINFLALIGWNPGTEQELFSLEELVPLFKIEQIHKAGARFDIEKAKWYNEHYLRHKDNNELASLLQTTNPQISADLAGKLVILMKDRATFPADMWQKVPYLFAKPTEFDATVTSDAKKWNDESKNFIKELSEKLTDFTQEWTAENIKHFIHELAEAKGLKVGKFMQAIRVATTGAGQGPDLMLMLEILGKSEVQARWGNI